MSKALELHQKLKGKISIETTVDTIDQEGLSLLYSPGVAEPCLAIEENQELSYEYTGRGNTIAVVTDGSAVLGLGNIGPEAAMPVMEGKAMLFKHFGGVNAVPICLNAKTIEEKIMIIKALESSFGGINLEDIKAPDCFIIEKALKETMNIPIFHDDQHGTAIVVLAGIINALRVVNKNIEDVKIVVSGTGAAGNAIINLLHAYGATNISAFNSAGQVLKETAQTDDLKTLATILSDDVYADLNSALNGADVFIGVSAANIIEETSVRSMANDAIVFGLANPNPEISYDLAKSAGAKVVATGRSDYPNQVNNILVFPGIFKGLLKARATEVTQATMVTAAQAIAALTTDDELHEDNILVSTFDERVADKVADAVIASV